MTPPLLIELGLKAFRHPRFRIIGARVAPWTGVAGSAAGAGVLAFEGSILVGFADPAAVIAYPAGFHGSLPRRVFFKFDQFVSPFGALFD
jgi:hypothetical protein